MNNYISFINNASVIIKLILWLFFGFFWYGLYRAFKGKVLIGLIWIFTGGLFAVGWIIDFVTIITSNKIKFLAD
ncbi:MAG: hypothetical protein FWB72_00610 [Firmicutes bacterium]|nr:hypothetical protein [Bacillota bacterium]